MTYTHKASRLLAWSIVVGLVAVVASPAAAVPARFWANSNGAGDFFTWQNGGDDNGLFGDPILVGGNTFVFFPSNFRAESQGAGEVRTNDRMEVQIFADSGFFVSQIIVTEFGDYQITGDSGQVDVTADLILTEIGGDSRLRSASLSSDTVPATTGAAQWDATASIDLSFDVPVWTGLTIELTNELIAIAAPGTSASIEKTLTGGAIGVTIIPEPMTAGLLAMGLGALVARRRRRIIA